LGQSFRRAGLALLRAPVASGNREVFLLAGGVCLYLLGMIWLGFFLSTGLFCLALLRWLGTGWRPAILTSLVLVGSIYLLFGQLFKVQLPAGQLGLPF